MRNRFAWMALLLLPLAAGCSWDCYDIEITPDGDGFQRRMTCWNETQGNDDQGNPRVRLAPLDAEKLARLEKIYGGRQTPKDVAKQVFARRFEADTPDDMGGAGSLTRFACPLGEATIYVEQFRGDDDLDGQLVKRQEAVDQLVEIVGGWLVQEMGNSPDVPRVKQFCGEQLRRDLTNAALYAWMGDLTASPGEPVGNEFLMRMLLYFSRRGYIRPQEVPQLVRAANGPQPAYGARFVQRVVARKIGVPDDQPVPVSLAFLADLKRVDSSLNEYVGKTEMYRRRLDKWKQQHPDAAEDQTFKPIEALGQLVVEDLMGLQPETSDQLSVRLASGREPVATNGQWDADTGKVTWSEKLRAARPLPVFCYAMWTRPVAQAQTRLFGKVVLDGQNLIDYVMWYGGLTPQERDAWNTFVDDCRPGAGLAERISGFRFPGEREQQPDTPDDEDVQSLADPAKKALLNGLEASPPEPDARR